MPLNRGRLGNKSPIKDSLRVKTLGGFGSQSTSVGTVPDHGALLGLGDDDHSQYVHISVARTISAVHTFDPGSATAPFILAANAQGQTVTGLKADQLNKSVTAGGGLTGGGALTSSISLDVGAGTGITVNANDVAINQAFTPTWTGAHIWSNTATFNGAASFTSTAAFTTIASDLVPDTTDTRSLGSSTKFWLKGWLAELDAVLFAQNVVTVIGGWLMISKGEGVLGADLGNGVGDTTATLGTTASISANVTTGDIVLFRGAGQVEYMKVTAGTGPTWTVTRDLDGSGRNSWPAGSVFVNLGYNGTGRIELNASSTPRISIIKQGTTYNAQTEVGRFGDLNGWGGFVSEDYGWAVGDYSGGNYAYYSSATGVFKIVAGSQALTINEDGMAIVADITGGFTPAFLPTDENSIRFTDSAGTTTYSRWFTAESGSGTPYTVMRTEGPSARTYFINAIEPLGESIIQLRSEYNGNVVGYMGIDNVTSPSPDKPSGKINVDGDIDLTAGADLNLSAFGVITTDNNLDSGGSISPLSSTYTLGGTSNEWNILYLIDGIYFGSSQDVRLYRSAADILRTPDSLTVDAGLNLGTASSASTGQLKQSATTQVWSTFTLTAAATGTLPVGTGASSRIGYWSGTNTLTGDSDFLWDGNKVLINDTGNTDITQGISIQQGTNDNTILALRSSGDVAHGVTSLNRTDTYAAFLKEAGGGGLLIRSFAASGGAIAMKFDGIALADNTTKSTAGLGAFVFRAYRNSGTGTTGHGANSNIVSFSTQTTTRFILDVDGDSHQDVGTAWTNFDTHDDVALLNLLSAHVTREDDPLRRNFVEWLEKSRRPLEKAKIVTFNKDGHHFINWSRTHMLQIGAIRQLAGRLENLERKLLDA